MNSYIYNLYNRIDKINNNIILDYNIEMIFHVPSCVLKLIQSNFVPIIIKNRLLLNINIYLVKFKYKKLNSEIFYFIKKNETNLISSSEIIKILKIIVILYELSLKKSEKLTIALFFDKNKKNMPKKGKIGVINVNSALCELSTSKNTYGKILIWRKEEYLKVLIHELLHSMNYDYNLINSNIDNIFKKKIALSNNYNIHEGWTEFITILLYYMIYCINSNKKFKDFEKMIEYQTLYSLKQASMIYKYSFKNEIFYENSNVFSYYIIKYCLLVNINYVFDKVDNIYVTNKNINKIIKSIVKSYEKNIVDVKKKYRTNMTLKMLYI